MPFFLEFSTYRWREHCGHSFDNDIGYRAEEEFLEWQAKDPLNNLSHQLTSADANGLVNINSIKARIDSEIESAFNFAESSDFPDQSEAYTGVYA
jgi:pyruvate dehydrogenase E1 component alpha subunit